MFSTKYHFSHIVVAAAAAAANSSAVMSVKKSLSLHGGKAAGGSGKRRRLERCFSLVEVPLEPGKQLKDMDSNKLKAEIKKWAKAVVAYARQLSGRFGSSNGRS